MEIQAGVENILDKQYHEHLDWGNINRPGRNVYAQIKIFF
jgi:iron complex outermembrane receptor protein